MNCSNPALDGGRALPLLRDDRDMAGDKFMEYAQMNEHGASVQLADLGKLQ